METIPADSAELDDKGRETSQYCLGLPTILRRILEQVSTKQLIQLSLVNKLWNFEARTVLRSRGNLSAYFARGRFINEEGCPCEQLEDLASDLDKMRVVPFSGLHFAMSHRVVCESLSKRSLQPSHIIILDRLNWKHFDVRFGLNHWENYIDCPVLLLIKKVLEDFGGVLEELTLGSASEQFLGPILQNQTLPRLRSLSIQCWNYAIGYSALSSTFIKKMVSCAPNLQELHINPDVDLRVNLLEESSAVLVPYSGFNPFLYRISEGLIGSIRSAEMEILIHTARIDTQLLNRFIPKVLEASRTTLKTLIIDYLLAVPLMCYGICLENVTTLKIRMNGYSRLMNIDPWTLGLPGGLDFIRVFPNLTEVTILNDYSGYFTSQVVSAFVQQASALLRTAPPDRATNIKHLDLEGCNSICRFVLPLLAHMFPHVKTVRTKIEHEGALFKDLREHFLCLEEVIERGNY